MIVFILIFLGLVFGSFVNAWVWRVHEQSRSKRKRADKRFSVAQGRSMCPHCQHELAAKDLVPVLSWLWLRGKCRYCGAKISVQYPMVELFAAVLFVLSYLVWPYELDVLGWFGLGLFGVFIIFALALTVYDLRWFLLPNRMVFPLIGVAIIYVVVQAAAQGNASVLWASVFGGALIFGVFWALFQVSQGKWIGGGDVKIAIALGLFAGGGVEALLVIFFASLIGTIVSLPVLMTGKQGFGRQVPFGPYLLTATVFVVLFSERIMDWYQSILL